MHFKYLVIVLWLTAYPIYAQESCTVFNFLKLPTSAHSAAMGGYNISLIDDDASLIFQNPALLTSVSDRTMNLNFMYYMQGSKTGSAAFTRAQNERISWGAAAQFLHYGSMKQTSAEGIEMGDFSALDMALSGLFCYNLTDKWAGGTSAKFIYSKYGDFSSVALAVDLGVNYYDPDIDFSFSAVAANLGGQIKSFGDKHEKIPYRFQLGFTKGMSHAPFSFSVTLDDLTRWSKKDFYDPEGDAKFGRILMNHFVVGINFIPIDMFYVSAGYNFRRANELKAAGSSHGAGLTFGGGLSLSRFKLHLAYAKYHVSCPSFMFSTSYNL